MKNTNNNNRAQWRSKWTFIFAASGAAVGLGNVWKFPYIAGEHGGGAFVAVYLICVVTIGIPLLMAEILIGRQGQRNPASAISRVAKKCKRSKLWGLAGGVCILSGFLILTYYSVITGWTIDYIYQSMAGHFYQQSPQHIDALFNSLVSHPGKLIFWDSLVMASTIFVVGRGLEKGLEKAVMFMFPAMLFLMLVLLGYSMSTGAFEQAVTFLFHPDFAKLDSTSALVALGHAFFTLSIATGSIMMYGSYLPKNVSVTSSAFAIAIADTGIALIAGLAIFPIVFANHLSPAAGAGLIFKTLPIAFGRMPYGSLFATLFFIMLFFAAFTSAISLLEPTVAWIVETFHTSRLKAVLIAGTTIWILSFGTIFSFNIWQNFKIFGLTIFDFTDALTANFLLPISGLLIAIFAAWRIDKMIIHDELQHSHRWLIESWHFLLRYISPLIIIVLFLNFVGILKF